MMMPSARPPYLFQGNTTSLLIRKCHQLVQHQCRHFTDGKVRSCWFWETGCKRLISSLIHKCVTCRRQRGQLAYQMSDLPRPATVHFGWCKYLRPMGNGDSSYQGSSYETLGSHIYVPSAVHIEVVEDMSASSFINALKSFTAIRRQPKEYRSDRGTNYVCKSTQSMWRISQSRTIYTPGEQSGRSTHPMRPIWVVFGSVCVIELIQLCI